MSVEPFVDTNIWIYAHLDQDGDSKGRVADALVESGRRNWMDMAHRFLCQRG